jgi:hypothetical protein
MQGIQAYLNIAVSFANGVLMPLLFGIAFIYFAYNIFNLYVKQADAEIKGRKSAVAYSIGALVLILSFWGIVNFLVEGVGVFRSQPITPDYLNQFKK